MSVVQSRLFLQVELKASESPVEKVRLAIEEMSRAEIVTLGGFDQSNDAVTERGGTGGMATKSL